MNRLLCFISPYMLFFSPHAFSQEIGTVLIGAQIWTTENLEVSHFRNGEIIPEVSNFEDWMKAGENKQPAWCYYNNDSLYGKKHGKLYNWFAVIDPRGLAPIGYHIPSQEEWDQLIRTLESPHKNEYLPFWLTDTQKEAKGFCALPSGGRFHESAIDIFYFEGTESWWWCTTDFDQYDAYCVNSNMKYNTKIDPYYKDVGMSVRCIKEAPQ